MQMIDRDKSDQDMELERDLKAPSQEEAQSYRGKAASRLDIMVTSILEIIDNVQLIQGAGYARMLRLLNPRPLAEKRPYTNGLPKKECLDAIGKGDAVCVGLYGPKRDYGLEAWFDVVSATPDDIEGRMKTVPRGWPEPASDIILKFPKWAVTDAIFADPKYQPLADLPSKKYRGWCLIDSALRFPDCKVQHIFREEPKMLYEGEPDDESDTGWRLSAASTPLWDAEADFVDLCRALDCDDSWLIYIDEPVGSAFKRDEKTGLFMPDQAPLRSFTREKTRNWWDNA
jgi:hypothetical protein